MFNYLIFDFDNTLYNYDICHEEALNFTIDKINSDFNILNGLEIFLNEKKIFQNLIGKTPASHSKYIQFKKFFEKNKIGLDKLDEYYLLYENKFNDNLSLYPNLLNFLQLCKEKNIKLYILTNNLCREQINKLNKLGIINYFEKIFTSEEFGYEKPDPKFYNYIIDQIGCKKDEIAMIGDNFSDDIIGSNSVGLYSFWFNKNYKINKNQTEFTKYSQLYDLFNYYFNEINKLIDISDYVGERFDLVQAGGGNTSVKIEKIMFIKASGINLTELDMNKNYVGLEYSQELIYDDDKKKREKISANRINESIIFLKCYKPSIETSIHSILKKYVIHFHPIQFNKISGCKDCKKILENIFENFCFVDYYTPGIDLALGIQKIYKNEDLIFLKNHGVIFTSNSYDVLIDLIESTIIKLENYLKLDFNKYKYVNIISKSMKKIFGTRCVSYLCEQKCENYNSKTFFPDKLIYCGKDILKIDSDIEDDIKKYFEYYKEIPKMFNKDGNIYVSGISLKKCREIEELWKSHNICVNDDLDFLQEEELDYLNNWDAEKFRKMIK